MDISWPMVIVALLAGIALGAVYFGGLHWTISRMVRSPHAMRMLMVSFVIRAAVLFAGLYFVSGGRWDRLLAALTGTLVARTIAMRWCRVSVEAESDPV